MRAEGAAAAGARAAGARTAGAVAAAVIALALSSCAGIHYGQRETLSAPNQPRPVYPTARFAVLSDPHLYDTALGVDGSAFQQDMDSDRKLLPESSEILSTALEQVSALRVDFLLIPGDLTKDGEKQNHLLMAAQLAALSKAGVRVFVVPGNHDVLNPAAVAYNGSKRTPVENITASEFADIYRDAGYGEALFRDPDSLSYVAEPVAGLWLLAVDSANYAGNLHRFRAETGSGLTQSRVNWIEMMLGQARINGKAVIVMMHHGLVEHFVGQAKYFSRYLVADRERAADMFASYGVSAVFTGHFHAQDIALRRTPGGRTIYDVETGSLVTFPDPLRLVSIDAATQRMTIESSFVKELPSFSSRGVNFWDYSRQFVENGTAKIVARVLGSYGVPGDEASVIAGQVTAAFAAHFRGDEHFPGGEMIRTRGLSPLAGIIVGLRKEVVENLWQDPEPPDNDLEIDLATGEYSAYAPVRASSSSASRALGTVSSGFTLYHER